jgi:hypothetical protein
VYTPDTNKAALLNKRYNKYKTLGKFIEQQSL